MKFSLILRTVQATALKIERRFLQSEVRAIGDAAPKIGGYAAKYNVRSQDLGGFVEVIAPGAFDECLAQNPDIVGLFNHNMDHVLGRTSSGTMRVWSDEVGVRYEIDPPDTTVARDLMTSMRRGDIRGSSFGFYPTAKPDWEMDPATGMPIRTITKASLFDCSPVTDPAYLQADSSVRSQLPENDIELRKLAAEMRQALTITPSASAPESDSPSPDDLERWRLLLALAESL